MSETYGDGLESAPKPTAHDMRQYVTDILEELYALSAEYHLDDLTILLGQLPSVRAARQ